MISGRKTPGSAPGFCLALIVVAIALAAAAVAGAEDAGEANTFSADGIATQSLGTNFAPTGISSVYGRPDGSLVAQQGERVVSFHADGTPDTSFPTTANEGEGQGVVVPAAGGKSFALSYQNLTRLNPDGTVDPSFGDAGAIASPDGARDVFELASGKLAVITLHLIGARNPNFYLGVTVLNADGSIDREGVDVAAVSPSYLGRAVQEIVPAPGGGALVVAPNFLFELNADGSPNTAFGERGVQFSPTRLVGARFIADGSIEAVGETYIRAEDKEELAFARFSAAGKPDSSFGDKGVRRVGLSGQLYVGVASWGADGSVIVGGNTESPGSCPQEECEEAPALASFDPAGNLAPGFGDGGILRLAGLAGLPQGYKSEGVTGLIRRADGSIVAVGNAPPNESVAFLAAFSSTGALLPSFGEAGIERVREPVPAEERVGALVPLPEGKLLAVGSADVGIEDRPILARYSADGILDKSFGGGAGYVDLAESGSASKIAVQGDKALVDAYAYPRDSLLLVGIDDGAVDRSFGSHGSITLPKGVVAQSLAFGPGGRPVVLDGAVRHGRKDPIVIQRLLPSGRPDPAFGHHGRIVLRPPGGGEVSGEAMIAAPGGRLLVGGVAHGHLFVARLLPDGKPDPRFGSRGWSITRVPGPPRPVSLARRGAHIYLAGIAEKAGHRSLVLMRLDSHGHLDRGFGRGGIRSTQPATSSAPTAVVPTRAGAVVLTERGDRPVVTFGAGGKVERSVVGPAGQAAWQVQGTASEGRLILGWHPLTFGRGNNAAQFFLSERPLEPGR